MARHESLQQLQGALALLKTGIDRGSARIEEMHLAIADKPFRALALVPGVGTVSDQVRAVHDGITRGVHLAIRLAAHHGFDALSKALDPPPEPQRRLPGPR
ncbi:hypothetical protein [Nevskia sp.]|uniref:hypothetical protein n=1 Tax=Nevskia sp. TaxID=1929292 RepID=UPI0025EAD42E|nr:hypothetical protein [Nevskia sp.]HET7797114.1 hypothetical protein [Nevskia sp.]